MYRYLLSPVARADCENESNSFCSVLGCPGMAPASAQPVEEAEVVVEATEAPEPWWRRLAVREDQEGQAGGSSARRACLAAEAESRSRLASA